MELAAMTHCQAGHPLTQENTYRGFARGKPRFVCRTCRRRHQDGYRETRRADAEQILTPAQKRRALDAIADGVSLTELAPRFGLSRSTLERQLR